MSLFVIRRAVSTPIPGTPSASASSAMIGTARSAWTVVTPSIARPLTACSKRVRVGEVRHTGDVGVLETGRVGIAIGCDDPKPERLRPADQGALVAPGADDQDGLVFDLAGCRNVLVLPGRCRENALDLYQKRAGRRRFCTDETRYPATVPGVTAALASLVAVVAAPSTLVANAVPAGHAARPASLTLRATFELQCGRATAVTVGLPAAMGVRTIAPSAVAGQRRPCGGRADLASRRPRDDAPATRDDLRLDRACPRHRPLHPVCRPRQPEASWLVQGVAAGPRGDRRRPPEDLLAEAWGRSPRGDLPHEAQCPAAWM